MHHLKILLLLFILSFQGIVNGQTELEIKTYSNYLYSWAIEKDQATARENARYGLLDTIFISILQEAAIDQTDTIFIKVIDYFEKKVGFKWQVIAFADISDVRIKEEKRNKIKVIPIIIGDPSSTTMKVSTNLVNNEKVSSEIVENEIYVIKTGNSILDELLILPDSKSLERSLTRLKADLKLNFGDKSNYPDDSGCYIFIIDRNTKQIAAVYDKGTGLRRNLLTNAIENNYINKNKGNYFVYVVIN